MGIEMEIMIVGCGKVGGTLVEQLSGEEHNITVVDQDAGRVRKVTNDYDAMGYVGNGVSYQVLKEAGIERIDLLIAVTGSDEQNLLCCVIARKASKCKTIARVRNPIYNGELDFLKKEFDLGMIINPELASAMEIARIFRFPSAIKIDTFAKGRVELLHFRIKSESVLLKYKLMDLKSVFKCDVLVCTVTREDQVFIPNGDFVFEANDVLAIVAAPKEVNGFFKKIGIETNRISNALIVGGGKIAYYLARRLLSENIDVKIIESNFARCEELSELLPQASIIHGDGTDQSLLIEEGLERAGGFAALTDMDEENMVLSLFASTTSKAKIVTKINRINFGGVVNQLHLESVIYPRFITADYITQYVRSMYDSLNSNVENLYRLEDNKAEALEFYIKEKSNVVGIPLEDLKLKKNILVCCIARNRQIMIPGGKDMIQVGDTVVVVLTQYHIHDIEDILEN